MNRSPAEFPSREEGLGFHLLLCDHDAAAVADVCRAYLKPLFVWVAARYPKADAHLREEAVHRALLDYVQTPERFNPSRADLATYLRMAARWDLCSLLKREGKHHEGRVAFDVVEDDPESGNLSGGEDPLERLQQAEDTEAANAFLDLMTKNFTEAERRVLDLMLAGERSTHVIAKALGIENLAVTQQEREVKKVKDRIKKRLERGVPHDA